MTDKEVNKDCDIFNDINYICKSTTVIVDALQKGSDVTQMPNGDIIITQVQVVHNHYAWNPESKKIIKISSQI